VVVYPPDKVSHAAGQSTQSTAECSPQHAPHNPPHIASTGCMQMAPFMPHLLKSICQSSTEHHHQQLHAWSVTTGHLMCKAPPSSWTVIKGQVCLVYNVLLSLINSSRSGLLPNS
jgi:hypothetical protein